MKKIDLGQAIVALANLGVIAGIVFLGFELRQTRIALQDSSHLSTAQLSQDSFDRLWEPGFASTYQAGMTDFSSLSQEERSQFEAYVYQRIWRSFEPKPGETYGNPYVKPMVRALQSMSKRNLPRNEPISLADFER